MDDKTKYGALAEAKTVAYFLEREFEVYTSFTGKADVDLILCKDGTLTKVSVKSTTKIVGNVARVQLKSVRANRTINKIKNFNPDSYDILAVYIVPIDKLKIFNAKDIKDSTQMSISTL